MKKLTIKNLAPYSGNNLKLILEKSGRIITMSGIYLNGEEYVINSAENGNIGYSSSCWNFKPLLRPLSDLTKDELCELIRIQEDYPIINFSHFNLLKSKTVYFGVNDGRMKSDVLSFVDLNRLQLSQFEYLFSKHIDVFSLIENNLAIDINTLKK